MVQKALDQKLQAETLSDNLQRISQAQAVLDNPDATPADQAAAKTVMERNQSANQAQLQALADKFALEKLYQVQTAMAKQIDLAENSTASVDVGVPGVDGLSWRLMEGPSASRFTLSSDGQLRFAAAQNFELDPRSHSLRVEMRDSAGHTAQQTSPWR